MHEFSPREPDNLSCAECSKGRYHQNHRTPAKAQEFLDRYGELIQAMLSNSVTEVQKVRDDAIVHGWHNIRNVCQEQIDETIAAMRELELLRGE